MPTPRRIPSVVLLACHLVRGKPVVQSLEERLPLPFEQLAKLGQALAIDTKVQRTALETRRRASSRLKFARSSSRRRKARSTRAAAVPPNVARQVRSLQRAQAAVAELLDRLRVLEPLIIATTGNAGA